MARLEQHQIWSLHSLGSSRPASSIRYYVWDRLMQSGVTQRQRASADRASSTALRTSHRTSPHLSDTHSARHHCTASLCPLTRTHHNRTTQHNTSHRTRSQTDTCIASSPAWTVSAQCLTVKAAAVVRQQPRPPVPLPLPLLLPLPLPLVELVECGGELSVRIGP